MADMAAMVDMEVDMADMADMEVDMVDMADTVDMVSTFYIAIN